MSTGDTHDWASYGQVEIDDAPEGVAVDRLRERAERVSLYRWTPAEVLLEGLPRNYAVELLCAELDDGIRRFTFPTTVDESIVLNSVGGLAILNDRYEMTAEQRSSYRAMLHFFQRVRSSREHLTRNFNFSRDLFVRTNQRLSDSERSVLPADIGLTANGGGYAWTVGRLTEIGREAALESGIQNPTSRVAIEYGLYEAARRNPLSLPDAGILPLLRIALFDGSPTDEIEPDRAAEIEERIKISFREHAESGSEAFNKWFSSESGNLTRQIANQRRRPFGALRTDEVRTVLLDLGWRSYEYVAQCLHHQMWCFEHAMPQRLNDEEWEQYRLTFTGLREFGGFPLVMLSARLPLIRIAVLRMWAEGATQELTGIIYRLFDIYEQMARNRREADRRRR